MELITNILIEYLKHNKRIVVPKLGAFIVKQPSGIIRFSELMRNDDGVLKALLMAYGVQELEASGMISRFVFEIRHAITSGKSFTVDRLGEFIPGENNTITFRYQHEPVVFGGNIKPPVITLDIEKERLQREQGRRTVAPQPEESSSTDEQRSRRNKRRGRRGNVDQTTVSSGRPEAYLRGLKYDKEKKKRGDDRTDGRRQRGLHPLFIIMLITLATGGAMWLLWLWLDGTVIGSAERQAPTIKTTEFTEQARAINEADTTLLIGRDTTLIVTPTPVESMAIPADDAAEVHIPQN
ncbi:MAG: hypothetical protein IKB24_04135 [Alistipes sp.]|nr:hypothetical protein [Alistipes sp.]